ncbi:MAG: nicotinate-nucleotide adenylyltransferase [Acutalibacteraceae bacterium]|nr:nicotinate-nucleotide adenylyltransferase [Clostridia bacterium]MEE3450272.1 nicotinate-nucleotide adenylyltransferase [Acutalibacteraceae bacterium]
MKQQKRIAMFGGTFNPIHNAHINLALAFIKKLKLDKLLLIPTGVPPHKTDLDIIYGEHRLNMCRLAVQDYKKIEVSDIEVKRGGKSYTADTLRQLKEIYPDSEFFVIMGADMYMTLDTWHEPDTIFSLATVCTVPRNNDELEQLNAKESEYSKRGCKTIILDLKKSDISATKIRKTVFNDGVITKYVDPKVEKYIYANYLYMNKAVINYERFDKVLKARMGEKRYIHSVNVATEAKRLATKYGADVEKARLAGILHDIAKETPADEQLKIIQRAYIKLNDVESQSPKLWHAIAGAAFVRYFMGIEDEDVFNAIRYHTSGRANMSLLEKCIFIADFTGAERDYDGVDEMRALANQSLEDAMTYGLSFSISDLAKRRLAIDPNSLACYNEMVLKAAANNKKTSNNEKNTK